MNAFTAKSFLFLFALLFLYAGCKKKDKVKPEPQPGISFTLINNSGTPGDLIQIKTDDRFKTDSVSITVGGEPVVLYRINDTVATCWLPVLSPGKVNIDLSGIGAEKTLPFTIDNYTPVSQPEAVKKELTDRIDKFLASADTLEDQSMISTVKGLREVFLSEYEKLRDQEKLQAAYVLQKVNMQVPGIARKAGSGSFPLQSIQKNRLEALEKELDSLSKSYTARLVATIALIGTGGVATWKGKGWVRVVGAGVAAAGVYMLKKLLQTEDNLLSSALEPFTTMLSNLRKSSPLDRKIQGDTLREALYREYDMVFLPDKAVNKKMTAQFRSISQANRGQSPFYEDIFQKYDQTTIVYLAIKAGIAKIRSWSSVVASIVPDLPGRETSVPKDPKTETGPMPAEVFSIENISDPGITLKKEAEDEILSLTAAGKDINTTKEFTFDLVFQNEKFGINLKRTIRAVYYGDGAPPESVVISTKDNVPAKISGLSQSLQLEANVLPEEAKPEVAWSIVNGAEHAEVDAAGKVTARSEGTVTVRAAAKADPAIYDEMEVIIKDEGYVLEIGTMAIDENTDTESFVPLYTIKQGERASISLPNYLMQPVRLTYHGQLVKFYLGSTISYRLFQYNDATPNSGEPVYVPDYTISFKDEANSREVKFHIDLTLTNEAYSAIVGKTLKITRRPWRIDKVEILLLTVNSNGTYTIIDKGTGATRASGKYQWSGSYIEPYLHCGATYSEFYYVKRPPGIGSIQLQDVPPSLISTIIIEEGNTYRSYSCPTEIDDLENEYIRIEKYDE